MFGRKKGKQQSVDWFVRLQASGAAYASVAAFRKKESIENIVKFSEREAGMLDPALLESLDIKWAKKKIALYLSPSDYQLVMIDAPETGGKAKEIQAAVIKAVEDRLEDDIDTYTFQHFENPYIDPQKGKQRWFVVIANRQKILNFHEIFSVFNAELMQVSIDCLGVAGAMAAVTEESSAFLIDWAAQLGYLYLIQDGALVSRSVLPNLGVVESVANEESLVGNFVMAATRALDSAGKDFEEASVYVNPSAQDQAGVMKVLNDNLERKVEVLDLSATVDGMDTAIYKNGLDVLGGVMVNAS